MLLLLGGYLSLIWMDRDGLSLGGRWSSHRQRWPSWYGRFRWDRTIRIAQSVHRRMIEVCHFSPELLISVQCGRRKYRMTPLQDRSVLVDESLGRDHLDDIRAWLPQSRRTTAMDRAPSAPPFPLHSVLRTDRPSSLQVWQLVADPFRGGW
jgi:hypothetical protein